VVTPYCDGGELFDQVKGAGKFEEEQAKRVFGEILQGVEYIHSMDVAHRDLSLENVLVNQGGNIVMDFGMAMRVPNDEETIPLGRCGKPNYMAPEIAMNRDTLIATFSDIWSLGIVLFIMLSGIPPVEMAIPTDPRFAPLFFFIFRFLSHIFHFHSFILL